MAITRPEKKKHPAADISVGISQAQGLMRQHRFAEARQLLAALDRKHPNHSGVLLGLAQACEVMQDWPALLGVAERLVRSTPGRPEFLFSLGRAYRQAGHPALALRTFRRFLAEYPEHQGSVDASQEAGRLDELFRQEIAGTGLPAEDAIAALEMNEEVHSLGSQHRYGEAQKVADALLFRFPRFVLALNSLAQIHLSAGDLEQALLVTEQALSAEPGNLHAHARRVRVLCLLGRLAEARSHGAALAALPAGNAEAELRRAEAHSYLGDDEGVLGAFRRVETSGTLAPGAVGGTLCHLAAVAELRLGREAEAARLWNEALKLQPGLEAARQNVADRCKPIGEQHAPWPFPLDRWVPQRTIDDLNRAMEGARGEEAMRSGAQCFLAQHPEMAGLAPALLDRGDAQARGLALTLAEVSRAEPFLLALREFAQGMRGPDLLRNQAAHLLVEAGLLPAGPLRLWMRGRWGEVQPLHFEVEDEPVSQLSPQAARLLEESTAALDQGNPARAETLLRKAVELAPDFPLLLNNLAAALSEQRRIREADAVLDEVHRRFPDFVAGITNTARRHLRRGEVDQAEALLKPLLSRKRFDTGEFMCLCVAQIELLLARKDRAPLSIWLQMWEQASPEHPSLEHYRQRIEQAGPP